jgi:RNA polymerase sigma-70 factor (ECF subfamily)
MSETIPEAGNKERLQRHKDLMQLVATHRDKQAFGELFDHFAPLLRSYSLAREPGAALLADELAQDVLIKVWNKAHTYKPELAAVSTWIFTLARNARIDHLRRNGRFSSEIDPTEIFDTLADEGPDPFQLAQQQRVETLIHEGMKQLPVEQSQVLAKVYLEGKSHQETAQELDLPLGTVKSRVRLALQKLELLLKR